MKRILILIIAWAAMLPSLAQQGLHIDQLFQGRIVDQERIIETRVRGKSLEKYLLSYYRSVRMKVSAEECKQLSALLEKDKTNSIDMRSFRKNANSSKTYTCKLQLPAADGKNRYLCYQEQWNKRHDLCEVTVIYMEGRVESLEKLEVLLKK